MCSVICFNILCLLAIGVTGTLLFIVAMYPQGASVDILSILIFFVAFIVFASGMTAGLASIVVENKGPAAAIGRSWNLCKSKIGFIFCCAFCFYVVEFICKFVTDNVLSAIAASITDSGSTRGSTLAVSMAASWLMGLLLGPLNAILDPTIYFSLRIQKEGLTLDVLQEDLALFDNSIEVQTGSVYGSLL